MHLKQLEMIGFKSFAERISIDFVPGVTAVVGPNGSGKSNVTDAIRWVLGEQSAKSLRGGRMEDVIFSGSDSRSALNFAEVTLTLQNDDRFLPIDYNEVGITRRVYRSGESDFYINKQRCRLRDIVDLFMDSGLGRESFSIISQGKVEQILNSKAEERRTIFEEAAGVLKYKNRKRKAEVKLEETRDNLHRVNDIIHELEDQVEPLKKQAAIASDYLEKKAALESIEVALTVVEIEKLHERWQESTKQLEEQTDADVKLSTAVQTCEAQIVDVRERMVVLDEEINELQANLLVATEELENLSGRKNVLHERKKHTIENKEQLAASLIQLTSKRRELEEQSKVLEKERRTLDRECTHTQEKMSENDKELTLLSGDLAGQIDGLKNDYFESLTKQANVNNEIKHTEEQTEQLRHRFSHLHEKNEKHLAERNDIKEQKAIVEADVEKNKEQIKETLLTYREVQEELTRASKQEEAEKQAVRTIKEKAQKVKSRRDALEEMDEDYAGFYQGVKQVLRARENILEGINGAIAELIDVPKQYETALEIALGAAMQHIVVANEQCAREAIHYLKKNNYGRATFLPISVIRPRKLSAGQIETIKNHAAFVGVASELISYEEEYADVLANLLGTVIVTTNLQGANELAKLLNHRYRLVTLDGNVVHPGGSMTGGGVQQKSSSILSRKSELDALTRQVTELSTHVLKAEQLLATAEAVTHQLVQQLEEIRQQGEELRVEEQTLRGDIRGIEVNEKNINERLALFDMESGQMKEELAGLATRIEELHREKDTLANSLLHQEEHIANLTSKKDNEHASREALLAKKNDLHVRLNVMKESLRHQEEQLQRVNDEIKETDKSIEEQQTQLHRLDDEMALSATGESDLEKEAREKEAERARVIESITSKRTKRLQLQQETNDLEVETKQLRIQAKQSAQHIKEKEVQLNRLDVELDNKLTHLSDVYLLTFEGAKEQYELEIPLADARKQVKIMKRAIDALGTVNIGAIEEYERVAERYEFLTEQKADLVAAMETLFSAIDEMDDEMKKRFEETFVAVRSHFEAVFQALFGGGRADLVLDTPEDMLNTGVDIIAQPPGKSLQNLALLSGGERALTAIALLFSILKVRPVPFCVLDEVEAALDEANVQRFSTFLRKFSEETQFIVITHRKGTMEGADVLYGITMQESGVSKLVSVRLEEAQEMV